MALTREEQERVIEEVIQSRGRRVGRALGSLYGPVGELLGTLVDVFALGQRPTRGDIRNAIDLLMRSGFRVEPGGADRYPVSYPDPPELDPQPPRPEDQPWYPGMPTQPGHADVPTVSQPRPVGAPGERVRPHTGYPPGVEDDAREDVRILPTIAAPHIDDGSEADVFANMIETPQSSNVWGFGYDHKEGILYVAYKAPGANIKYTPRVNSCSGESYQMGHRSHIKGPIYAYGSKARPVPASVYEDMKSARSKGEFVWHRLRVCGSLWEHQVPYILVAPSVVGDSIYVPRKASRDGFRVRTVPTVGWGRRKAVRSTLPGIGEERRAAEQPTTVDTRWRYW